MSFEFHKPIIILENPKYEGNVGMVCRLIANFGLEPLRIIQKQLSRSLEMEWMAYAAHEELGKVKKFPDIADSIFDVDILIGTSMFTNADSNKNISLTEIPDIVTEKKYAVLFGREDFGLSRKSKDICDYLIDFQLPGYQKSMNLSHSVSYILSYLHNWNKNPIKKIVKESRNKNILYKRAREIFEFLGMNEFHENENLAIRRFQNILERANLSDGDVDFFFKIFREIERLKANNKKDDSKTN